MVEEKLMIPVFTSGGGGWRQSLVRKWKFPPFLRKRVFVFCLSPAHIPWVTAVFMGQNK